MKRVLVTGAGGQLGRSLQEITPHYDQLEFLFLDRAELDITDPDEVQKKFTKFRPHYCINCAAYTKVDQAERTPEPAFEVNVHGVENLARACTETGTILIHISTDYVFDGRKSEGYRPEDQPNPINIYGKTKLEGERIIQQHLQKFFIIRTSWLYSKKYGPNFYLTILRKAREGEQITVTDAQKGCPTDAANLARHILELIKSGNREFGISHFTDGEVMSWYGFAKQILKDHGLSDQVSLAKGGNYVTFAERPKHSELIP